jgi:TrmH family RNA methyltransferase
VPTSAELDRLRVVLVAPRNPLNIGAAARAMSNFGFHSLRLVNPYGPSFREARSAVGASEILANAERHKSVAEAVKDCTLVIGTTAVRTRDLQHQVRRPEYGARLIQRRLASSNVALLFGSEKFGLSNDSLSHCHWLIRIPTCDENISMNLGQAVAVCLYELIRESKQERAPKQLELATAEELERITVLLLEALGNAAPDALEDESRQKPRRLEAQNSFPLQVRYRRAEKNEWSNCTDSAARTPEMTSTR